jgi:hypothetical protein
MNVEIRIPGADALGHNFLTSTPALNLPITGAPARDALRVAG